MVYRKIGAMVWIVDIVGEIKELQQVFDDRVWIWHQIPCSTFSQKFISMAVAWGWTLTKGSQLSKDKNMQSEWWTQALSDILSK